MKRLIKASTNVNLDDWEQLTNTIAKVFKKCKDLKVTFQDNDNIYVGFTSVNDLDSQSVVWDSYMKKVQEQLPDIKIKHQWDRYNNGPRYHGYVYIDETVQSSADIEIYDAFWYRYPNGIEGEPMYSQQKEFTDFDRAVLFLQNKVRRTRGIYWAGAHIEDSKGNWLYEIADDGTEYNNRK